MKQNANLVKLAKITNTAASFLIFLAGLMLIFLPSTEVTSLQRTVLAVLFLLTGAAKMIGYYSNDLYRLAFQFDFAIGILCALLAGLLAFLPQRVLPTLPVLLSVYVILDALLKLQIAMDARRFGMESWIAILCSSLLLGLGGLFAGLLSNAGIGLLVLLRTNRNWKENAAVVAILYGFSVLAGIAVTLLAG